MLTRQERLRGRPVSITTIYNLLKLSRGRIAYSLGDATHASPNKNPDIPSLDGVNYINNAFGYPSETRIAAKRLVCIYDKEAARTGMRGWSCAVIIDLGQDAIHLWMTSF